MEKIVWRKEGWSGNGRANKEKSLDSSRLIEFSIVSIMKVYDSIKHYGLHLVSVCIHRAVCNRGALVSGLNGRLKSAPFSPMIEDLSIQPRPYRICQM